MITVDIEYVEETLFSEPELGLFFENCTKWYKGKPAVDMIKRIAPGNPTHRFKNNMYYVRYQLSEEFVENWIGIEEVKNN